MTKTNLPKYVYRDRGYVRFIRRARGQAVMMKEEPGTPEFWDHYNRLLKGRDPLSELAPLSTGHLGIAMEARGYA